MKETGFLKIIGDRSFDEKQIHINPNDGFDIGLMMTEATVQVFLGESPDDLENNNTDSNYARLYQKNDCKLGTIEMSMKTLEKLGKVKQVRLHLYEGDPYPKLLISAG